MISNREIIIFNDDWGRFPSTLQHVAKELMKHNNRVFWIGSLGLRRPKISLNDFKRIYQKLKSIFIKPNNINADTGLKPILIHPFVIPYHDYALIRLFNRFSISGKVNKVLKEYQAENPILITSAPVTDNLIGELGESCSVYYCVDDYTSMEGAHKSLSKLEEKLVNKVDAVFAVSNFLMATRKPAKGKIFYAPQGVETSHFLCSELAPEVKNIKKPVIGFFGLISEWIDLDLIKMCLTAYPESTFLFIGKSVVNLSSLLEMKNFIYLGAVEYSKLPEYASAFDVGLIPFDLSQVSLAANPLKLMEYFSMGIPVVSTNLPEVQKFYELAFVAKDREEFVRMIGLAVDDVTEARNHARKMKAGELSWQSVTKTVFDKILSIESRN
jgi:glycosyltransferase involved in cell wall biosynthesis